MFGADQMVSGKLTRPGAPILLISSIEAPPCPSQQPVQGGICVAVPASAVESTCLGGAVTGKTALSW